MRAGDSGLHQSDGEAAQPQSQDHSGVSLRGGPPGGFEHQQIRLGHGYDIATLGNDVPEGRACARDGRIWGESPFHFKRNSVNLLTSSPSLSFFAQVGHFVYRARTPFHPQKIFENFLFQYFVIKNEEEDRGGQGEEDKKKEEEEEEGGEKAAEQGTEGDKKEDEKEDKKDEQNGDRQVDSD